MMIRDRWYGIFLAGLLLFVSGCGSSRYFMLTEPPATTHQRYSHKLPVVGVEKISLPEYMKQGKVARQISSTQIDYLDNDNWLEDMEESLTKQLIVTIQKSFDTPSVYAYPWGLSKQATIKVQVRINKFIAQGAYVYLDANYEITHMKSGRKYSQLFSTKVATKEDTQSIVSSMNIAFSRLSKSIMGGLNRF
ncbi:hypothetical protein MNB_SV-6-531 [hydrothermal vent metagenome]|uniref:ABC-type transport auxiliary lipoprotein component domain-containing protein n=1 Tax=hydrothermal vent metagenome TaxID=652676 RepID=A0A1W1CAQ2_9ZZZZ